MPISVQCQPTVDGWRCTVTLGDDPAATVHEVTVGRDSLRELAPAGTDAQRLVHASLAFLLEREPRESILRAFDLPVVGRYFPEYTTVIRERLGG
jgi:hypothetical protein